MAAPLFDVREALVGQSGERSAQDVLGALRGWVGDGTIVFAHLDRSAGVPMLRGAALLLLQGGEVRGRRMVGRFAGLASTGLAFQAVQHAPADVANLPAVNGGSTWAVPRAAPRLTSSIGWPALGADLPGLHRRLEEHGWSGILSVGTDAAELWRDGRVVAARAGAATGPDALRALRRAAAEDAAAVELAPLDGRSAAALHGLAEGQRGEGMPAAGLVCERDRTLYVVRGEVELAVAGGAGGGGTFTSADRLATAPLRLPDEPAGWESHRYALTLRGRDALNPMTDRWSGFDRLYGEPGRTLLEAVGRGEALDVVARATATDFDALRKSVERWEAEGVVRRA
jgi:hypothetical protein